MEADFKGVWVKFELLRDTRLTHFEKLLVAEIAAFHQNGSTFWKSNEQIAADFNVSLSVAKRGLKNAIETGHICVASFNGRVRHLSPCGGSNMTQQKVQKRTNRKPKSNPADRPNLTRQVGQKRPNNITKEVHKESTNRIVMPAGFDTPEFVNAWNEWKEYKRTQHRFAFKTLQTELISIKSLHNDTGGNAQWAVATIARSIANGYKGLFPEKRSHRDTPIDQTTTLDWLNR